MINQSPWPSFVTGKKTIVEKNTHTEDAMVDVG